MGESHQDRLAREAREADQRAAQERRRQANPVHVDSTRGRGR